MFNPTNLDEICVKAKNNELKGNSVHNFSSAESSQTKEGKTKGKGKHAATMKKGDMKLSCSHCQRDGHDAEHCWKLHPKLKPKWFKDKKGSKLQPQFLFRTLDQIPRMKKR